MQLKRNKITPKMSLITSNQLLVTRYVQVCHAHFEDSVCGRFSRHFLPYGMFTLGNWAGQGCELGLQNEQDRSETECSAGNTAIQEIRKHTPKRAIRETDRARIRSTNSRV